MLEKYRLTDEQIQKSVLEYLATAKDKPWHTQRAIANVQLEALQPASEAGRKEGFKEALNTVVATGEYDEGKQVGIEEERERIFKVINDNFYIDDYGDALLHLTKEIWQALKENK